MELDGAFDNIEPILVDLMFWLEELTLGFVGSGNLTGII